MLTGRDWSLPGKRDSALPPCCWWRRRPLRDRTEGWLGHARRRILCLQIGLRMCINIHAWVYIRIHRCNQICTNTHTLATTWFSPCFEHNVQKTNSLPPSRPKYRYYVKFENRLTERKIAVTESCSNEKLIHAENENLKSPAWWNAQRKLNDTLDNIKWLQWNAQRNEKQVRHGDQPWYPPNSWVASLAVDSWMGYCPLQLVGKTDNMWSFTSLQMIHTHTRSYGAGQIKWRMTMKMTEWPTHPSKEDHREGAKDNQRRKTTTTTRKGEEARSKGRGRKQHQAAQQAQQGAP